MKLYYSNNPLPIPKRIYNISGRYMASVPADSADEAIKKYRDHTGDKGLLYFNYGAINKEELYEIHIQQ